MRSHLFRSKGLCFSTALRNPTLSSYEPITCVWCWTRLNRAADSTAVYRSSITNNLSQIYSDTSSPSEDRVMLLKMSRVQLVLSCLRVRDEPRSSSQELIFRSSSSIALPVFTPYGYSWHDWHSSLTKGTCDWKKTAWLPCQFHKLLQVCVCWNVPYAVRDLCQS